MKTLIVLTAAGLSWVHAVSAQSVRTAANAAPAAFETKTQGGCSACAQKAPAEAVSTQTVPGTNEVVLVGRIENLMPIAVVAVLGCETCAGKAVAWALKQGSPREDVERALNAMAAMQNLDCFKSQFDPDAAARLEKPLAAARKVLQQATDGPAK